MSNCDQIAADLFTILVRDGKMEDASDIGRRSEQFDMDVPGMPRHKHKKESLPWVNTM